MPGARQLVHLVAEMPFQLVQDVTSAREELGHRPPPLNDPPVDVRHVTAPTGVRGSFARGAIAPSGPPAPPAPGPPGRSISACGRSRTCPPARGGSPALRAGAGPGK